MLTPGRALALNTEAGRELPRIKAFRALYELDVIPRHGELVMIAGRSGSQKSGLALYWVAAMGLPTLYFSADMSAHTASSRLASMVTGDTFRQVEQGIARGESERYTKALANLPITFSFNSEITWSEMDRQLRAYVELHDAWPEVIVLDNLMDIEGCGSEYSAQMDAIQNLTDLARMTGATILLLHHATDKTTGELTMPASRKEIKGGMSEKPELTLSVALDPDTQWFRVAPVKNRNGFCDPTAQIFALLHADPARTRFSADPPTRGDHH